MSTPEPSPQPGFPDDKIGSNKESRTDQANEFAALLDDFMDEEVVDKNGAAVGTLACYWQSVNGWLVFLGIKIRGQEGVRVVPGLRSQVDDQHACIRLDFEAEDIESAPSFDCANELDAVFERAVYEHFEIGDPQPHGGLRYFSPKS